MSEIKSPSGMNSQGASSRLRPLGGRWGGGISTGRGLNSSGNGGGAAAAATAAAAFAPVPREVGAGPAFQVLGLFICHETHCTAMVQRGGIIYHIDSRLVQSNNGRRVYVVSPELLVAYVTRFAAGRGRGSGSGVGGVFRVFYLGYDPPPGRQGNQKRQVQQQVWLWITLWWGPRREGGRTSSSSHPQVRGATVTLTWTAPIGSKAL